MSPGSRRAAEAEERRSGTRKLVERLLAERREMLVLYEQAAGVAPYAAGERESDIVRRFAQVLVDYVAAGHFGLYERITEGRERRHAVRKLAAELYPAISASTDAAMAFNDALGDATQADCDAGQRDRLAALGEHIARRIELEDRLIAALVPPRGP